LEAEIWVAAEIWHSGHKPAAIFLLIKSGHLRGPDDDIGSKKAAR